MYISPLFQKMMAYAESLKPKQLILSAKYGLLRPDDLIEPYETDAQEDENPTGGHGQTKCSSHCDGTAASTPTLDQLIAWRGTLLAIRCDTVLNTSASS